MKVDHQVSKIVVETRYGQSCTWLVGCMEIDVDFLGRAGLHQMNICSLYCLHVPLISIFRPEHYS